MSSSESREDLNRNLLLNHFTSVFQLLGPFIIICYLLLSSIIESNLKGIVLVVGLCFAYAITIMVGNMFPSHSSSDICQYISIGGVKGISKIPLSTTTYLFVSVYLLYTISRNSFILPNLISLLFFPVIILGDLIWLSTNKCFSTQHFIASILIGSMMGMLWGYVIDSTKNKHLQFLSQPTNNCLIPKRQTFKCAKKS